MKKKIVVLLAFISVFAGSMSLKAEVVDKLVLYFPNRIVDMFDIFSIELGVGPAIGAELRGTRLCDVGGNVGIVAKVVKDCNRQYGACIENGWNTSLVFMADEDTEREITSRWVKKFWYYSSGIPLPSERIYNFYTGARDYWELSAQLTGFVHFKFALHPVEIADFITGWFFIDLKGDDFTADDLK